MLLNEIIHLLMGCIAILLVSWIYLEYRMRHLPSLEELILEQERLCEEMLVLNSEFMAILNKRKIELDNEIKELLREDDDPYKTFH